MTALIASGAHRRSLLDMTHLTRYLGFNIPEWMYMVFVAYTAFLAGGFNEWRSPSAGLGVFYTTVVVPLFFTAVLGLGPVLVLRGGVRLVRHLGGAGDPAEEA